MSALTERASLRGQLAIALQLVRDVANRVRTGDSATMTDAVGTTPATFADNTDAAAAQVATVLASMPTT